MDEQQELEFKKWLQKEGLWLNDSNAEETRGGVRAKAMSKRGQPGSLAPMGGGMGGMGSLALR